MSLRAFLTFPYVFLLFTAALLAAFLSHDLQTQEDLLEETSERARIVAVSTQKLGGLREEISIALLARRFEPLGANARAFPDIAEDFERTIAQLRAHLPSAEGRRLLDAYVRANEVARAQREALVEAIGGADEKRMLRRYRAWELQANLVKYHLRDLQGYVNKEVAVAVERAEGVRAKVVRSLVGLLAAIVLFALVSWFSVQKRVIERLRKLKGDMALVGAGRLDHHVETSGSDELTNVARTFDNLRVELRSRIASLEESERARNASDRRLALAMRAANIEYWTWDLRADAMIRNVPDDRGGFAEAPAGTFSDFVDRVHAEDRVRLRTALCGARSGERDFAEEFRLPNGEGSFRWLAGIGTFERDERGEAVCVNGVNVDITLRKAAEDSVRQANQSLEKRVEERTAQLSAANKELEAFSYSISHDLRAPLRGIDGFSEVLLRKYSDSLDEQGRGYLKRVKAGAERMSTLIDDLLALSRLTRKEMRYQTFDLGAMADEVLEALRTGEPARAVTISVQKGLLVHADKSLLHSVMENLLGNAWKFTSKSEAAEIHFGAESHDGERVFFVRDNGAGFEMEYGAKLFQAFQRLHSQEEFTGTGVGLASVQRVIRRHGGRVWAHGEVHRGATFLFTLGQGFKTGE